MLGFTLVPKLFARYRGGDSGTDLFVLFLMIVVGLSLITDAIYKKSRYNAMCVGTFSGIATGHSRGGQYYYAVY